MTRWTQEQFDEWKKRRAKPPALSIPAPQSSLERLRALGRLPAGEMNKTEAAYAEHLELLRRAGEVLWSRFESIKLRLADRTFLTVDFAVLAKDSVLEMHDVKGAAAIFQDDARVKMKVAASLYPFRFKAVMPIPKKKGGGWSVEEF